MEKKKAERERQKAEKERLKQEVRQKNEAGRIPEPQEDIVDNLLKEIRAGTTLRPHTSSTENGWHQNRCTLKKEDMQKLEMLKKEDRTIVIEDLEQKVNGFEKL